MTILIKKKHTQLPVSTTRVRGFLKKVLSLLGMEGKEVSIFFTDDEDIKEMNRFYLGKNRSTNVISFPLLEGEVICETNAIGDIVISVDTAQREAQHAAIPLDDVIDSLLIHGLLHLIGYNHEGVSKEVAKRMADKENEIFYVLKGYYLER